MEKKKNRFVMTVLSIILGLLFGAIALKVSGYSPIEAYKVIWLGIFEKPKYVVYTIIRATPIIITGISVAFAFRTGLFNIGAEGQFLVGSLAATLAGVYITFLPPVIHAVVCILVAALAAGIWGGIVGLLKAKRGVNEVISSIMLNWIALYLSNTMLTVSSFGFKRANSDSSHKILESAKINLFQNWKVSEAGRAALANNKLLKDILTPPVNAGIIIAIVLAIVVWYILKHTTLGYQLKAVGYNKDAAEYAGIDIKKNITKSMFIAGAIAGIAGATQVLGVNHQISILGASEGYGFDGMAVALIAGNNPLATIPAGLLFGGLKYGGAKLNSSSLGAPSEIINIVIGVIVLFVAMPKLYDKIFSGIKKIVSKKDRGEQNV